MFNTEVETRHKESFRTAVNYNDMLCPLAAIEELCENL